MDSTVLARIYLLLFIIGIYFELSTQIPGLEKYKFAAQLKNVRRGKAILILRQSISNLKNLVIFEVKTFQFHEKMHLKTQVYAK